MTEPGGTWLYEQLTAIADEAADDPEIAAGRERAGVDRQQLVARVDGEWADILAAVSPLTVRVDAAEKALADAIGALGAARNTNAVESTERDRTIGVALGLVGLVPLGAVISFWEPMGFWRYVAVVPAGLIALFGLLTMFLEVLPDTVRDRVRRAREDLEQARAAWRTAARASVLSVMRQAINRELGPSGQRTTLEIAPGDAPGLVGDRAATDAQVTGSVVRFRDAVARVRSGSIGLAGPRGVGKTTLIEAFAGQAAAGVRPLKVVVSAPVQYEARDFLLHLFAKVCLAVLDRAEQERPRPRRTGAGYHVARFAVLALIVLAAAALAAVPVVGWGGLVGKALWQRAADPHLGLIPAGVLAAVAVVLLAVALAPVVLPALRGLRAAGRWLLGRRAGDGQGPFTQLAEHAEEQLRRIRYLQTHTHGWSGKLAVAGTEGAWNRSLQLAEQALTYPEVIDQFAAFLGRVAEVAPGEPAVVIAVDELDKIESPEAAQRFVNEIKGAFAAPRTQFVISVSDDALAAFERRGMPVRDAFDSAFEDIVRVDHLDLSDTSTLLNSWVVGLPQPFVRLAHCLAGGLPRDVRRFTRAMVAVAGVIERPSLADVADRLITEDLERKTHAMQIATGQLPDDADATELLRLLRDLRPTPGHLSEAAVRLREMGDGSPELTRLANQAAAYLYHCATLLRVFTAENDELLRHRRRPYELLATAKQELGLRPRLAWLQIEEANALIDAASDQPIADSAN
ncbi:ATP-binding protein [Actinokineospora pegani]|uniref:ATP-binding protein n=1 Tax=Actinokineospora pegani TaxID=2654637 RepID=UPI0012EA9E0E|nr:ATP-binding protein [Actinokineospora pegani]